MGSPGNRTRDLRQRAARRLRRFGRDTRGSMVIFGIFCFMIMLLVAGLAIDLMRFESRRALMQSTLDRAVLAAADMNQLLNPEDVVADYFNRAGLDDVAVTVAVDSGLNFRTVSASTEVSVPTLFIKSLGVPTLQSPAASTAEERIGNVEISLVLDISGSMGWSASGTSQTKIALLQNAASEFVDTMFDTVQEPGMPQGKLSISIVPYNQQVALGADLGGDFNLSSEHDMAHCVDFSAADFSSTAISPTQPLSRAAMVDARYSYSTPYFVECQETTASSVLAFSNSSSALKTRISQLAAGGDTAIDVGMKWGAALLDPALQPMIADRITRGDTPSELAGRPFAYTDSEAMKVVVVMTDGENTNTYGIRDEYKSGPSDMVRGSDGRLYYYYPARSGSYDFYKTSDNSWKNLSQIGGSYQVIDYSELWTQVGLYYYSNNYVREATGWSGFYNAAKTQTSYGTKDTQLLSVCSAAKAQGVLVFAIGFEAPSSGRAVMRSCATSDAFYYDAAGVSISDAFAGIASAINALRLTQ